MKFMCNAQLLFKIMNVHNQLSCSKLFVFNVIYFTKTQYFQNDINDIRAAIKETLNAGNMFYKQQRETTMMCLT